MRIVVMGSGGTGGILRRQARAGGGGRDLRGAGRAPPRHPGARAAREVGAGGGVRRCARPRWSASTGSRPPTSCSSASSRSTPRRPRRSIRPVVGPRHRRALHPERRRQRGQAGGHPRAGPRDRGHRGGVRHHRGPGRDQPRAARPACASARWTARSPTRARAFLAACGRAGIPAELAADPLRMLWEKYVFLVAQSGMTRADPLSGRRAAGAAGDARHVPAASSRSWCGWAGPWAPAIDEALDRGAAGPAGHPRAPAPSPRSTSTSPTASAWSWRRCRATRCAWASGTASPRPRCPRSTRPFARSATGVLAKPSADPLPPGAGRRLY